MTEENVLAEEAVQNPPAEADFSSQDEGENKERDFEAEALEMGWVPQEKFKGAPEKWTDAKTFVEKGETFIPYIQADRRKLKKELEDEKEARAKEKREFDDRLARLEKASERSLDALKKQHEKEVASIAAEQRKAVAAGDTAAFDRLEEQKKTLEKAAPTGDVDETPQAKAERVKNEWVTANPWFKTDYDMHEKAVTYSQFIVQGEPDMTVEENLKRTEAFIREKFPEKFGGKTEEKKPAANGHAAVDVGSALSAGAGNGQVRDGRFSKLPTEAVSQFKREVQAGMFKDDPKGRAEFAELYFS